MLELSEDDIEDILEINNALGEWRPIERFEKDASRETMVMF